MGLGRKVIQSMEHGAIYYSSVVEEFSGDLLKEMGLGLCHGFGEVKVSHLLFLAIVWWNALGWCGVVFG